MALIPDENAFYRMFEGDPEVMLLIDPDTGDILDANQAATEFYGYSRADLCSMRIQEINTLPSRRVADERLRALHGECNYFVFPHRLANGDERIVEVYSSPVVLSERHVLFSIVHDITNHNPNDLLVWRR